MSEGKFDAAIEILREDDLCRFGIYGSETDFEKVDSILKAIKVLEAAGKVDKQGALESLDHMEGDAGGGAIGHGIQELLDALPDGGKE